MSVDKLFDVSKKNIDKHFSAEDYLFIQDQKGLRKSTFGGKDLKLVKQVKRQLAKKELIGKRRKASEAEQELLRKAIDSFSFFKC